MKIIVVALLACVVVMMTADVTHAECGVACPSIYMPVCAKDAQGKERTFPSECDVNVHNCRNPNQKYTLEKKAAC